MLVKVVAAQLFAGQHLTLEDKIYLFKQRPDYICLPEYHFIDSHTRDYREAALSLPAHLEYIAQLSYEFSCTVIGGTAVQAEGEKLFNTSFVYDRGALIGSYRKRLPVENELRRGITPGTSAFVFEQDTIRAGLMICGDVFNVDYYRGYRSLGTDIIFIPTSSPLRADEPIREKYARDQRYFVDGACTAGSFVVKTCGIGEIFGQPRQGRSLVAAPWGVLERIEPQSEQQQRFLVSILNIAELREFRTKAQVSRLARN